MNVSEWNGSRNSGGLSVSDLPFHFASSALFASAVIALHAKEEDESVLKEDQTPDLLLRH